VLDAAPGHPRDGRVARWSWARDFIRNGRVRLGREQ
jgi:hypothetical protein